MISLFLSKRGTTYSQMITQNGDIIIEHCISATVKMDRNAIWYLTIEVPENELLGYTVTDESVFKVDLNFIKGQLFRMIYTKYNRIKRTYTFYASHIFFDVQYECMWSIEPKWKEMEGCTDPPSSWDDCLTQINNIFSEYRSAGISLPYSIIGDDPADEFCEVPEVNRPFYMRCFSGVNYGAELYTNRIEKGDLVTLYRHNRSKAQRFYLIDKGSGYYNIVYQFGNRCVTAGGGNAVDGAQIVSWGNPGTSEADMADEIWSFTLDSANKACRINSKMNSNYVITNKNGSLSNQNPLELRTWSGSGSQLWKFTYCDIYQYLKWDGKNIIECLFGSDSNSMANVFPQVAEHHVTAMLDNYSCYFGRMTSYPADLLPRQIYLTDKEITDFSEKRSMENVKTGIIPKGSSGEVIKEESGTNGTRVVKGPYWNSYEVKRITSVSYDDITFSEEKPDDNNAFSDKAAYDSALQNAALMDLRKKKYYKPDIETTTKIVNLFKQSNPTVGNAKLNDELIYISNDGTRRQKFYFESLTYDILLNCVTGAEIVEETEVE